MLGKILPNRWPSGQAPTIYGYTHGGFQFFKECDYIDPNIDVLVAAFESETSWPALKTLADEKKLEDPEQAPDIFGNLALSLDDYLN